MSSAPAAATTTVDWEALQTACRQAGDDEKQSAESAITTLQHGFQSLLASVVVAFGEDEGPPAVETVVENLSQFAWNETALDILVDALWLQSSLLSTSADNNKSSPLTSLIRQLVVKLQQQQPSLPTALLTSLEGEVLQAAGILSNQTDLQKKLRWCNTATYYKQTKYQLLVESSQGYAKLLRLLLKASSSAAASGSLEKKPAAAKEEINTTTTDTPPCIQALEQLIGTFALDPCRCLDLTLDVLELEHFDADGRLVSEPSPDLQAMLRHLVPAVDKLPQLLGFKLKGRQSMSSSEQGVASLLGCMTWLVQAELLDASEMLRFMPPWQEQLATTYAAAHEHQQERVQAMSKVSLSGGSGKDSSKEKEAAAALQQKVQTLQDLTAIQWFQVLPQQGEWPRLDRLLSSQSWSQLCFIFPHTFGKALSEWILDQVKSSNQEMETQQGTSMEDKTVVLDKLWSKISRLWSYIHESGCIRFHPVLFSQLCRLVSACLLPNQDCSEDTLDFLQNYLLPSLSRFPSNPALSMEVWSILQKLPYTTRYRLYQTWRGSGLERAALKSNKPLWLISGELQAGKDVRYSLKRLSKDNIWDVSKNVAKVCHSHPLVVFTTILNQIESYDNLVQVVVDALRFVTPLSLDVLGFCILSRLSGNAGGVNRSRLKADGVNVSQWLQSLESFTGALYKRYPFLELRGILCYLMRRIKDGHVMELGVLRTLLKVSGGWAFADYAPAASLTATQLEGRAGSTLLKRETMSFGVHEDFNPHASEQVRKVLQNDNMAVSLLILLAQIRHQIVFEPTTGPPKPIKLIGNLVDQCQVVMTIIVDFLTNSAETTSLAKFAESIPTLTDLHSVYGVDVASSWFLCRPLIRAASSSALETGEEVDGDSMGAALLKFKSTDETMETYQAMLPESTWEYMSTDLFAVFYTNTLYDLFCPENCYSAEIERLKKEEDRLARQKTLPQAPVQPGPVPKVSDEEEMERVKKVASKLATDRIAHKEHVESVHSSFSDQKEAFFPSKQASPKASMTFLSRCIYPRCMQGPDDAMYCAHFIRRLHDMGTPGFGTLHLFDSLIVCLSRALFGMTEGEAANTSILLFEIWKTVSKWRYDKDAFDKELASSPGSFMAKDGEEEEHASVSYKEYEGLYNKWHDAIGKTVLGCLQSTEYMHKRNCLVVLRRMVDVYPTQPKMGRRFLKALEPLQDESYQLADIKASAQAYNMQLIKARDEGSWKEEDAADIKARADKEKAAAAARQKKGQEQMAEMKRETEKITEEIGGGFRARGGPPRNMPPPPPDASRRVGGHLPFEPPPHHRGGAPQGRGDDRRGPPPPPRDDEDRRGRDDRRGPPPRDEEDRRGRAAAPSPPHHHPRARDDSGGGGRMMGRDDRGALDGRWERGPGGGGGRAGGGETGSAVSGQKRGRPLTPPQQQAGGGDKDTTRTRRSKRGRDDSADQHPPEEGERREEGDGGGGSGARRRGSDRSRKKRKR